MLQQRFDVGEVAARSFDFMVKLFKDVGNLLLLIVLNIIPIVNFIVLGYFSRVVKLDLEEPPRLSDYGDLFIEGLKLFVAALIYVLVPLIFLSAGFLMTGAFAFTPFAPVRAALGFLFLALGFLLLLAFLFIGAPALAIYMRTGDFSKVFAFGEAWGLVQEVGIGNYLLFYLLILILNLVVAGIGSIIPLIGSAIAGVFAAAFTFKALSLLANVRYRVPPPPSW